MISALISAVIVAAVVFVSLSLLAAVVNKLRQSPDRDYRWGVWLFSALSFVYAFITSLGRQ